MWVFTIDGFYSAVEYIPDPSNLLVRCRDLGDAERLCKRLGRSPLVIQHTPKGDYEWRLVVSREDWGRYLTQSALDIDYVNFKRAVGQTLGHDRASLYLEVWATMLALQRSHSS